MLFSKKREDIMSPLDSNLVSNQDNTKISFAQGYLNNFKSPTTFKGIITIITTILSVGLIPLGCLISVGISNLVNRTKKLDILTKEQQATHNIGTDTLQSVQVNRLNQQDWNKAISNVGVQTLNRRKPSNQKKLVFKEPCLYMFMFVHMLNYEHEERRNWNAMRFGNRINISKITTSSPNIYFVKKIHEIHTQEAQKEILEQIKKGFSEGKSTVVIKIGNPTHTACLALNSSGTFRCIDALGQRYGNMINISKWENLLDREEIVDQSGEKIRFHGDYIHTGLQVRDHHCERYANLYSYQIAVEGNVEAYKKVNGAFVEGKMETFAAIPARKM